MAMSLVGSASALAQGTSTFALANELGSVLGAEKGCGLKFNQDAIKAFIEAKVKADDMKFPSLLSTMSQGAAWRLGEMSESEKTAYCAQVGRVARTFKFVGN
jgi:hypothetical protein